MITEQEGELFKGIYFAVCYLIFVVFCAVWCAKNLISLSKKERRRINENSKISNHDRRS